MMFEEMSLPKCSKSGLAISLIGTSVVAVNLIMFLAANVSRKLKGVEVFMLSRCTRQDRKWMIPSAVVRVSKRYLRSQ